MLLLALGACACGTRQPEPSSLTESATGGDSTAADGSLAGEVYGSAPVAVAGSPSVVAVEPQTPTDFPVPEETEVLDQFATAFYPSVLLARVGQPVQFQNSEDQLHNVTVTDSSGTMVLNVATPSFNPHTYRFEEAGVFDVSCGIHPSMAATIVVVSTPWAVVAADDGGFSIPDVPFGAYDVRVWNLGLEQWLGTNVVVDSPRTEVILTAGGA